MTERELTGLMYKLLSPKENPERWRLYLEFFDKHVLRLNMSANELDSAKVYGEYETEFVKLKDSRYIDLVIITNKRFIPIEVKIKGKEDAVDQPKQCYDYWSEAQRYTEEYSLSEPPVLYYLTPDGESPSRESAGSFGFEGNTKFIRSDKIDAVAFCSEGFYWIDDCKNNPPTKDRDSKKNLRSVSEEIKGMIDKNRTYSQSLTEKIMRKFFIALDNRFDESFCKKYRLKRGGNRRVEIGDCYTYKRFIYRFFGRAFSWPSICLYCTDAAGNVIKFDDDKELWFRMGCYNGKCDPVGGESTAFCAGFMIFSNKIKEGLYKPEIKRLLDGKNILPQKIVDEYDKIFNGLIGRTDLHDEHGNLIYFTDVDKTLDCFMNQEEIDQKAIVSAVEHIMTEIENLLRRVVYG